MKYSEPVVVQFQSDISLRNSSCAKFSCGGVFTPYQCARNFFSCENFSCSNYNIENKGQYPSFDLFVKLITMFDVSVDQFIHTDGGVRSSSCRKHIDVLLNSMNEKELFIFRFYE